MPRFFINEEQISEGRAVIVGEDAHHIARSLRMAVGEEVILCDRSGKEYSCIISGFLDDREVYADVDKVCMSDAEPKYKLRLFQALPKGDKLDSIIQKAVECGASEIFLFQSEHCVVKIKKDSEDRKNERRQKIALSAAKQCGRSIVPLVHEAVEFNSMLKVAGESDLVLFCYEGEGTLPIGKLLSEKLSEREDISSIAVIVGSEGGFSKGEVAAARAVGMIPVGLGKRILRTETASSFALACIACITELN